MDKEILGYGFKSRDFIIPILEKSKNQILYLQSDGEGVKTPTHPVVASTPLPKLRKSGLANIDSKTLSNILYYTPFSPLTIIHLTPKISDFVTALQNKAVDYTIPNAEVYYRGKQIDNSSSTNIEKILFNLAGEFESSATRIDENIVASFKLDLTDTLLKGNQSKYRFTRFLQTKNVIIFIEEIPLSSSSSSQKLPENMKLVVANQTFDLQGNWDDNKFNFLHQAISLLTVKEINLIKGLKFKIESQTIHTEGGHYDLKDHLISIQESVFVYNNQTDQFGQYNYAVYAILHEIGHAIDYSAFNSPLGHQTKYSDTEAIELSKLKTHSGYLFDKNLQLAEDSSKHNSKNIFRKTFSGYDKITNYGRTNWQENFAESYAVYKTDSDTFNTIRPKTASFFKNL
ncbi:MAG: hypothetical protein IPL98_09670 [Saprospiraceae bacterium]|nr:hypothetical protein [Saprospiraceae bacterium]